MESFGTKEWILFWVTLFIVSLFVGLVPTVYSGVFLLLNLAVAVKRWWDKKWRFF